MNNIIAGDYNGFIFITKDGVKILGSEVIVFEKSSIVSVSVVDETQKEKFSKGWGTVGLLAVGPIGLFVGAIAKNKSLSRVLDVRFRDGKKILVNDADGSLLLKLQRFAFDSDKNFAKEKEDARIDAIIAANQKPEIPLDPETAKLVEKYNNGSGENIWKIVIAVIITLLVVMFFVMVHTLKRVDEKQCDALDKSVMADFADKKTVAITPVISPATQAWVISDRLDRYTCPSTSCGVVGWLGFREGVSILEMKNGWARISKPYNASCVNGISEYVNSGNRKCETNNGIVSNKFSEWVVAKKLSQTRPEDLAKNAGKKYELVKGSDDFKKYKNAFAKAADKLIAEGYCSAKDFTEMGGWMKSAAHGNKPIYFTYCGGMTKNNKIYLNAKTGDFSR